MKKNKKYGEPMMSIDLHSHILPGIDDGARDMETSLEMLKIAERDGIRHIVATPHFIKGEVENPAQVVLEKCEQLKQDINRENIKVDIYPGSEVYMTPEIPELLKEGRICTLNGSSYVLVELPMTAIPIYAAEVFYRLKLNGFEPILAHPERNREIAGNPNILFNFIQSGVLAQINAASLMGFYGSEVKNAAWTLLKHGMVHFAASDSHTCRGRAPRLSMPRSLVAEKMGEDTAQRLFELNGLAVLNNERIDFQEPSMVKKRKSFSIPILSKLFRKK